MAALPPSPPSFADLIHLIWLRKLQLALCFVFSALVGATIAFSLPERFASTSQLAPPKTSNVTKLLSAPLLDIEDRNQFRLTPEDMFSRFEYSMQSANVKSELHNWYTTQTEEETTYEKFLENLTFQFPDRESKSPVLTTQIQFQNGNPDITASTLEKLISLANKDAWVTLEEDFTSAKTAQINAFQQTIDRMRAAYLFDVESSLAKLYERKAQTEIILEHTEKDEHASIGDISVQLEEMPIYLMRKSSLNKQLQYINTRIMQLEQRKNSDRHIENLPIVMAKRKALEAITLHPTTQPFFRYNLKPQVPDSPAAPHKPLIVAISAIFGTLFFMLVIIFSHFIRATNTYKESE